MFRWLFKWVRARKAAKVSKDVGENMFKLVKEIRDTKSRLDDYMWIMEQYHADCLPDQTAKFAEATEFNLTSLISCYGIACDRKKAKIIKDKLNEQRQIQAQ